MFRFCYVQRTALIQPAVAMAHACEVDACVERDGEVPPAVNVTLGYNVVSLHVPNVAYTTWTQEDVCVTLSTPEMIARKVRPLNTQTGLNC